MREPSFFVCAALFCGPWQFSHWMFAKRAVSGKSLRILDQFPASPCVRSPEVRNVEKFAVSSMPPFSERNATVLRTA